MVSIERRPGKVKQTELAASIGAGGFLESGGTLVREGSFGLTCPGELSKVMLRLRCQVQIPPLLPRSQKRAIHRDLVVRCLSGAFTRDSKATPRFMAFMNDRSGIFLVLGLARESELVLGLAVGNLVNAVEGIRGRREKFCETGSFGIKRRKLRTGTTRS